MFRLALPCLWHWWGLAKVWCVNRQSAAGSYCAAPHSHTTTCEHRHTKTKIKRNKNPSQIYQIYHWYVSEFQITLNLPIVDHEKRVKIGLVAATGWWTSPWNGQNNVSFKDCKFTCIECQNHENMIVYLESSIFSFWYWCYVWGYAVVSVWDYKWQ